MTFPVLSDMDLAEIKTREKYATPGPWTVGHWGEQCHIKPPHQHGKGDCKYEPYFTPGDDIYVGGIVTRDERTVVGTSYDSLVISQDDAKFIALCREAVPKMIAEIETLRTRNAILEMSSNTGQQNG